MAVSTASLLRRRLLLLLALFAASSCESFQFIYNGFNSSDIALRGATVLRPTGALRLTDTSFNAIGRAFHPTPIPTVSSFQTSFVFQIRPSAAGPGRGGYGLAFTLSPTPVFAGAAAGQYMGVFNSSNDNNPANHIFMVEFDTVNGYNGPVDTRGNHVGININGMHSVEMESATYYLGGGDKEEIGLEGDAPIQAWIEYDWPSRQINVTICPLGVPKPSGPLISETIDLSAVLVENMYAGFSAATGRNLSSSHYITGWSFRLNGTADELLPSRLPSVPVDPLPSRNTNLRIWLASSAAVALFIVLVAIPLLYRRFRRLEEIESWELDCPHRFRYEDLHKATKGFKVTEVIGVGGFGIVYRGLLPSSGTEVAVKRIVSNGPLQGTREFAAEVESLGRLRHKNLVNLQGWCKHRNHLFLVYDYVPNGSLDALLFRPRNGAVLPWEQRFNILKGVACGLLYLHEEWERVVIHRDVKSSNVLIDRDMGARLGDFGLARLYDRGQDSRTTNVVGTVGYIAPELTQTGKPTPSTDVFAFGTLLLEVASGRPPVVCEAGGNLILAEWVLDCLRRGNIFEAADPILGSNYVAAEMELVLTIGLLCSLPRPEARPDMKLVVKHLNGDELPPEAEDLIAGGDARTRREENALRILGLTATDRSSGTASYGPVNSFGAISCSSFDSGR